MCTNRIHKPTVFTSTLLFSTHHFTHFPSLYHHLNSTPQNPNSQLGKMPPPHSPKPFNPPLKLPPTSIFAYKALIKLHPFPSTSKPRCRFLVQSSDPRRTPPTGETLDLASIILTVPNWADRIKEKGMRKKRELYTHEKWLEHRSSLRHVRHLASASSSRVILSLIPPVVFFTSVAALIAGYNSAVGMQWLPEYFPVLRASSLPYQLTAPALALLLVFRTEASYSRFEEARKAWTKVIAGTNDFARQVIASVDGLGDLEIKVALLQYIKAFPFALKCHLVYGSDIRQDLKGILEAEDLAVVLSSKHRPFCIIEFISQSLQLLDLEGTKRTVLESKIACFHEGIGVCEQIEGIPIPLSYTRLTSRFLVLWHLTLPIILWDDCHWMVVPATFISAASLFCIEEVGVLIEEPFPMLALDALCKAVSSDIEEAVESEEIIRKLVDSKRKTRHVEHSHNGWPG